MIQSCSEIGRYICIQDICRLYSFSSSIKPVRCLQGEEGTGSKGILGWLLALINITLGNKNRSTFLKERNVLKERVSSRNECNFHPLVVPNLWFLSGDFFLSSLKVKLPPVIITVGAAVVSGTHTLSSKECTSLLNICIDTNGLIFLIFK